MGKNTIIFLLVILAIAVFFRLWQLDSVPSGLYPDEAINANEALDSLENGQFKIFYPENNGREGLFIWLLAFSFALFGPSIWAIKIVPAIFGILTVLGLYLLTKEIFSQSKKYKAQYLALLASFFLAISFWHINFSRIGFRAILIPFVLVFGFYFLLRAFKNWKNYNFVISGIFFGLGFYTYISYRGVVLILLIFLVLKFIDYLKNLKKKKPQYSWAWFWNKVYLKNKWWKIDFLFFLVIFLVALPIGIYFLYNPGDFFGRAAGVSVLNSENPFLELGKSLISHLAMFNFYGDANWRHNFSGSPQLLLPVGIFFLIGLIISIKELIISKKKKNRSLFITHCLLLSWFLIMLLPGFLSSEGIPHALRVIGAIPVIYIFSAVGFYWLFKITKVFYKSKTQIVIFYLLLSIFFLALSYAQFDKYFNQWAKKQEVADSFSKNYVEIGNYLNSLPFYVLKYVIVNQSGVPVPYPDGIPMPAQTSMFIERTVYPQIKATYLLPEDLKKIKIEKDAVILPLQYDQNLFLEINNLFPQGAFQKIKGIWVYKIKD